MTTHDGEEYMTTEEAAALLGISRRTLDRYADEGRITRYRQGITRRVTFRRTDVEALYRQRTSITPDTPDGEK